jgi:hypothetical protein
MKGLGVVKLVDTLLGEESSEEEERSGAERSETRRPSKGIRRGGG